MASRSYVDTRRGVWTVLLRRPAPYVDHLMRDDRSMRTTLDLDDDVLRRSKSSQLFREVRPEKVCRTSREKHSLRQPRHVSATASRCCRLVPVLPDSR